MKKQIFTIVVLLSLVLTGRVFGQNVGIGEPNPGSKLSVKGGMSVGSSYSTLTAPTGGLIMEGRMGLGTSNPDTNSILDMSGSAKGVKLPYLSQSQRTGLVRRDHGAP